MNTTLQDIWNDNINNWRGMPTLETFVSKAQADGYGKAQAETFYLETCGAIGVAPATSGDAGWLALRSCLGLLLSSLALVVLIGVAIAWAL